MRDYYKKMSKVSVTKQSIASAIRYMGQTVDTSDTFRSYADKIKKITTADLGSKTITENGTYSPTSSDKVDAWSTVTVNVPIIDLKDGGYYKLKGITPGWNTSNMETGPEFYNHVTAYIYNHNNSAKDLL